MATKLENITSKLQTTLDKINALPEAGGGNIETCNVTVFKNGLLGGNSGREIIGVDYSSGEANVFHHILDINQGAREFFFIMQKNSFLAVTGDYDAPSTYITGDAIAYTPTIHSNPSTTLIQIIGDCEIDITT